MRAKRWFILPVAMALLLTVSLLAYSIYSELQHKQAVQDFLYTLPAFQCTALDSTETGTNYIQTGQTAVLLFFSPDCEYCQAQAKAIGAQLSVFKNIQFLWISDDTMAAVRAFAEHYGINRTANSKVVTAPYGQIKAVFGIRKLPAVLIYDEQHRLIRQFSGETKWEAILQAINDRPSTK